MKYHFPALLSSIYRITRHATILSLSVSLLALAAFGSSTLHENGKIAFASGRDRNREIYVMNADGTNQVRLTNNAAVDDFPSWSPDGKKIAYLSQDASSGKYMIKIMNADGTGQAELTPVTPIFANTYLYGISWFPDGHKIAFPDGDDIYSINTDGTDRVDLTNNPALDTQPSISQDGRSMAFTSNRDRGVAYNGPTDVYIMNLDDHNLVRQESTGGYWSDFSPDLSRSGQLAFVIDDGVDGGWISDGPGVTYVRIVSGDDFDVDSPKWSPTGTKMVFTETYLPGGDQIFVYDIGTNQYHQLTTSVGSNDHPSWQPVAAKYDFDGDGRSDISLFRPSDRTWYLDQSTAGYFTTQFGISTDKIAPADFDGDGTTDIAVFRDGVWYWINSSDGSVGVAQFGQAGDVPVPADYSGDGRDDLAVYRNGVWWTYDLATAQVSVNTFGLATDQPVPADYDGDGKVDQAVFRAGEWHLNRSSLGYTIVDFGAPNDVPAPADYDGDGKVDPAVYRDGTWYLDQSGAGSASIQWGLPGDVPTPGDYDGDGKADPAVFRPSSGYWYLYQSVGGIWIQQFGLSGDLPASAAQTQSH